MCRYVSPRRGLRGPCHHKRRFETNYCGPQLQRVKRLCCPTPTWPGHLQNNLYKYPLEILGKVTKVTSIYSMLRWTVAGRIDRMGRVAKPETLERAPRYEYNPGNIASATHLWLGVIPINNHSHCLVLNFLSERRILRNIGYTKEFHTLTSTDTYMLLF